MTTTGRGDSEKSSVDLTAKRPMIGKIFMMYDARCFKADAMDFDDILINIYRLFNQNPEILYKYQEKFKYILIDATKFGVRRDTEQERRKLIKEIESFGFNSELAFETFYLLRRIGD